MKVFLILLGICLTLSGCSITSVTRERTGEPAGELELKAVRNARPEKLSSGIFFIVRKDYEEFGRHTSRASEPIRIGGLTSGTYFVEIRGRGMENTTVKAKVKEGQRTTLEFRASNARHRLAFKTAMKKTATVVGEVLLAIGLVTLCVWGTFG